MRETLHENLFCKNHLYRIALLIAVLVLAGGRSVMAASPAEIEEWLQAHNNYRTLHGVPSVTWSNSIAVSAQNYADTCPSGHSGSGYGENMAFASYNPGVGTIVQWWYDEEPLYDYNNPGYSSETGHFTQVVWNGTTEIGCGFVSNCPGDYDTIWVCQYAPAGNILNQFLENVFPPIAVSLNVTPSVSGGNGFISPDSIQAVPQNGTIQFSLTPDTGYYVSSVTGTCNGTLSGNVFTTDPVTEDCTVVASFSNSHDPNSLSDGIKILQITAGLSIDGIESINDVNGDVRIGLAEAIFALHSVAFPLFTVTSSSFTNNGPLALKYTLYGDNISPQLSWENAPVGTEYFGILMEDVDAESPYGGNWWHWKVTLPKTTTSLTENAGIAPGTNYPEGTITRYQNDFYGLGVPGAAGTDYDGPRPPAGSGVHHYHITVSALDSAGTPIESVTIIGTYEHLNEDCNGEAGGTAFIDDCGTCVGGNTGQTACVQDCNGDSGGTAFIDDCGTCVGGNTGQTACVLSFTVTSSSFTNNGPLALKYTLYGDNISPQLSWTNVPVGTEYFGILMYDIDAESPNGGNWRHWKVQLPKTTTSLAENAGAAPGENYPDGYISWYYNDFYGLGVPGAAGTDYDGPRPPAGSGVHHYYIDVLAIDSSGVPIESATIVGTYEYP